MGRGRFIAYLLMLSSMTGACKQLPRKTVESEPEQYISDPNSVPFDIQPVKGTVGTTTWLATYSAQGKIARFKLEFGPSKAMDDKGEFDIRQGEGRFLAESGSDASVLLADLKKALEAKVLPAKVRRVPSLSFIYVSFSERQSQASGGGFNSKPPGNWTPMKIFIGEGEGEGQIFVNINPVMKKGQFSIKDEEYGDIVLAQLAGVL